MPIWQWLESYRVGFGLFAAYVLVMDLAKWRLHKRIDKAIRRTWRAGKIIHGPDL